MAERYIDAWVDEICDKYEGEWRAGRKPLIEDYLNMIPEQHREKLSRELVQLREELMGTPPTEDSSKEFPPLVCPSCERTTLRVRHRAFECSHPNCGASFSLRPKDEPRLAQVSNYKIIGLLGEGGMGRVWFAHDDVVQRYVALKIPKPSLDPQLTQRFLKETRTNYSILENIGRRARIPRLLSAGRDGDVSYIAFEFVPGTPLSDHVSPHTPFTSRRAAEVCIGVARTLQLAHDNGIVHRDIKPSNILITDDAVYLCDFGLAKAVIDAESPHDEYPTQGFVGTIVYASPEHHHPKMIDARSDVFSLGVVLYELLCGERPFKGASPQETLLQIIDPNRQAESLSSRRAGISPVLSKICNKCLAKRPQDRFQSAGELADALEAFVRSESTSRLRNDTTETMDYVPDGDPMPPTRNRASSSLRHAVVGGMAVFLLAIAGWLIFHGPVETIGVKSNVADSDVNVDGNIVVPDTRTTKRKGSMDRGLIDAPADRLGSTALDREIAIWVVDKGGKIATFAESKWISSVPEEDFALVWITFDIGTTLTDEDLKRMSELENLRRLSLSRSRGFSERGIEALAASRSLRELETISCDIPVSILANALIASRLEDWWGPEPTDADIESITMVKTLKRLAFHKSSLNDQSFAALATMPRLEELSLNSCLLPGRGLAELTKSNSLQSVMLQSCKNSEAEFGHLSGISTGFPSLILLASNVPDACFDSLAKSQIRNLTLGELAGSAIPTLMKWHSLRSLDLTHTKTTPDQVKRLREALPECRVLGPASSTRSPD